jgi:hypothetical protein
MGFSETDIVLQVFSTGKRGREWPSGQGSRRETEATRRGVRKKSNALSR